MVAQHVPQRRLEQMSGGMVARRRPALVGRHREIDSIPFPDNPFFDPRPVDDKVGKGAEGGDDLEVGAAGRDPPRVTGLTAGFAVERGGFGDDLHLVAGASLPDPFSATHQHGGHGKRALFLVADKTAAHPFTMKSLEDRRDPLFPRPLPVFPRLFALPLHTGGKTRLVESESLVRDDVGGEIQGKNRRCRKAGKPRRRE
jgi:hypothetical protein